MIQLDLHDDQPSLLDTVDRYLTTVASVRPTVLSAYSTVLHQFADHGTRAFHTADLAAIPIPWILAYITVIDRRPLVRIALTDFYAWAAQEQLVQQCPAF